MTRPLDPFMNKQYGDQWFGACGVDDRIPMVRLFSAAQCQAALKHAPNLQATVLRAIQIRLRKLEREIGA